MSSESIAVRLGDICEVVTKGTTPTTVGYQFVESGINFVKSESVTFDGAIDRSKFAFIEHDTHAALRRSQLQIGDILFSMAGVYIGKTAVVPADILPANTNQAVGIIRLKKNIASPRFIDYYIRNPAYNRFLNNLVSQSAQPNFNLAEIKNLPICLPPLSVQLEIEKLLGRFDDRITLLRETNATLEAIAQALFKSWFVDFDPVRAKMDGRIPEGMDEATAALFPDGFEESELGLVPCGWTTSPIYDLATFINGAAYKAFQPNSECRGRPIIKIAELKSGVTEQTAYSDVTMPDKYLIVTGDILFSWSGNPDTSIDTFVWTFEPAWLNQHIFRVLPRANHERTFVLQTLRHLKPVFTEMARNKQTTGLGHVTVADMKREHIVMPTPEILKQFDLTVSAIHARIFENLTQAQTLATLRDTLLPRLISAQLRIPQAEETIEEAIA
jgi:type I restriction enzyme S subunit